MEMTFDEIIDEFEYIKHVGNGEFSYRHCREEIALNEAEIILRKYQKIQEIVSSKTTRLSYEDGFRQIKEVVEDGSN